MQILEKDLRKNMIVVQVQSLGDLWTLYNIIHPGDIVSALTFRRVVLREGDKGERKSMFLELAVEKVEFHEYSNRLRITGRIKSGRIKSGPDDLISIGQYHTINVEIGTKLTIIKEKWFRHELERLEKSTETEFNKIIMVIAIESGLANIALLSNYSVTPVSTVRRNIPGKRYGKQQFAGALEEFFKAVAGIVTENIKMHDITLVIICGPGFVKEQFGTYLKKALKSAGKSVDVRIISASSGTESAIFEVLRNGSIASIAADHRLARETMLMEEFVARLGQDKGLCTYGPKETMKAAEYGAIETLMVTDKKLRTIKADEQTFIEKLFTLVEQGGGNIEVFSTNHPAGELLEHYGSIAALLRFKPP